MSPLTHTLAMVTAYWSLVYAAHKLLQLCPPLNLRYMQCQERLGLRTTFAYMRCYTKVFNGVFKNCGLCCHRKIARGWFNLGIIIGLGLMLLSLFVLSFSLVQTLFGRSGGEGGERGGQILTPIMPGVNLPWNQLVYYFVTLLLCGVVHEVGHALAAVVEQVRINGFGLFILFLYPGAFVDLHSDHLAVISPTRQLRIYCAGVWHNVVLVGVAILFFFSFPYLLMPFYTSGHGAIVVGVASGSALEGKASLGTSVIQVNSCPVTSKLYWRTCLDDIGGHAQKGYCISKDFLSQYKLHPLNDTREEEDGGRDCCNHNEKESHLCFSLSFHKRSQTSVINRFVCLRARGVVSDDKTCVTNDDCSAVQSNSLCITPTISSNSYLIKIRHTGPGDPILYLGGLEQLKHSLILSDYHPSHSSLPLWLPGSIETLCIYVASISGALAVLNIIPAYTLDGHWALTALLEYLMPENAYRTKIINIILLIGSSLLVCNVLSAIWILMNW